MKVAVCGCGVVGSVVADGLERLGNEIFRHDPIKYNTTIEELVRFNPEIAFVCVPTPQNKDGSCDVSIVEHVVFSLKEMNYRGIIAIKSTVQPGTTDLLIQKLRQGESPVSIWNNPKVCFVPEFLREKSAFYDFTEGHDTLVIGAGGPFKWEMYEKIEEAHGRYPKEIVYLSTTEAELVKYFSNVYNALRVTFANGFFDVCRKLGADYTKIKNTVISRGTAKDMYLDCNDKLRGFAGPCVTPQTKIYTSCGLKRIDDIKVGDFIYTIDGSQQKVSEVFITKVKNKRIWKITGQGLNGFHITSEHPIFAMRTNRTYKTVGDKLKLQNSKKGSFEWINAEELEKGDLIALPQLRPNTQNSSITDVNFARLLGYYAAEGNLENNCNRITLSFYSKENEFMNDINNILKKMNIKTSVTKDGNKAKQRFSDKALRELILLHVGRYSDKKSLSRDLMESSDLCVQHFLRGYFRGDGHLSENRFTVATISLKLFEQIKILLLRLGISFNTFEKQKYTGRDGVTHKKAFYIKVSNYRDVQIIKKIMGSDVRIKTPKLERKTSWFDIVGQNHLMMVPIKSIEKMKYTGDVYNLEVEGNNTYVVEDAIIHNCLPKDTAAFANLADKLGVDAEIFRTIVKDNELYEPKVPPGMRKK